jgi:putative endonuclease
MKKVWHVYICDRAGQLYTGITTDLEHRMKQHRAKLLYTEAFDDKHSAAKREKEIKGWRREKKMQLIKSGR